MPDHPEACAEWRDDLALYVIAQGTPDREAALEQHLVGCSACRAEAESLLAVAAVVLVADPDLPSGPVPQDRPSSELEGRIVRRISSERRRHAARRVVLVAAGAAAAAAVLVAALVLRDDGPGRVHGEQFAFTELPDGATAAAVVGSDGKGSVVQLTATGLDPATTYALWLTPPGGTYDDRVPAGTFRPDPDGDVDVRLQSALGADDVGRVWATSAPHEIALDTQ
jgi:anti-sigma factor RsiW